jgi:hypothetical protein
MRKRVTNEGTRLSLVLDTKVQGGYWEFPNPPPVAPTLKAQMEWVWENMACIAPAHRLGLVVKRGQVIGWTQRTIRYSVSRSRYRKRNAASQIAGCGKQPRRGHKVRRSEVA